MHATRRRSATRLGLKLLAVFAAATAVWSTALAPYYDRAIAAVAVPALHGLERTRRIAGVRFEPNRAVIVRAPGAELGDQRLELRTHHNNVPLLVTLMLVATAGSLRTRLQRLAAALALLALTHVAHFILAVHFQYALSNVGTYHVDDLRVLSQPFWERIQNAAELRKTLVVAAYRFQAHVGRLFMPVLLWTSLAPRLVSAAPVDSSPGIRESGARAPVV
jgi:hypothetical protein